MTTAEAGATPGPPSVTKYGDLNTLKLVSLRGKPSTPRQSVRARGFCALSRISKLGSRAVFLFASAAAYCGLIEGTLLLGSSAEPSSAASRGREGLGISADVLIRPYLHASTAPKVRLEVPAAQGHDSPCGKAALRLDRVARSVRAPTRSDRPTSSEPLGGLRPLGLPVPVCPALRDQVAQSACTG